MNELDLMETKDIMEYLARHRFSRGLVISGIANGNDQANIRITTFLKGKQAELDIIKDDVYTQIIKRNT